MQRWAGATLALIVATAGCRFNIDWSSHASYRSVGKDLVLAQIDPDEALTGVISANLHYMTVALDTVFVRNLPGLQKRNVAFGLEITGALPGGKAIKTVLEVKKGAGEHGFLHFDNAALVEPFLYTGQNLTISLYFRAVGSEEVKNLKGRLQAAEDVVKKIDPTTYQTVETGIDLFRSIIGGASKGQQSWKYQVTLHPADSVYRDKPEMLLTAARHILLFVPPASAPSELQELRQERLVPYLRLRGNRLIWRHNEREFTEAPYIILNITRYRRYPKENTELRRVASKLDQALDQGNLGLARSLLTDLAAAITADKVITTQEKNLERAFRDVREARIQAAAARKAGKAADEAKHIGQQVRLLSYVRTQFAKILYPYETKQIDYRVSQLGLRAGVLARDHGQDITKTQALIGAHGKAVAALKPATTPHRPKAKVVDLAKLPPPPKLPKWKHLYEKWWFWTLVSAGVAGVTAAAVVLGSSAPVRDVFATPPGTVLTTPPFGKVSR